MKTVKETASILGISGSRVIQLIHQKKIQAKKFGSKNWVILSYRQALKRAKPGRPKND